MPQQQSVPGIVVLGSDFKALGVVRSLGRRGVASVLVDNLPRSAWFSRYVRNHHQWQGAFETFTFVDFLLRLAKEQHLEGWVLFPVQDDTVELVAQYQQELSKVYRLVTPGWEIVRWANDKRLTYQMAEEVGVPYPRTWYPGSEDELKSLDLIFPVILKPAISIHLQHALRLKALPANTLDELVMHYRRAVEIIDPHEVMIQQIIPGSGQTQFSVGTFCQDGEVLFSMTARRTRQYPIDYGLGSSFVEAIAVPSIHALAAKLIRAMNVSGMVEVEFKYDVRDEQYKVLDINIRPWGWHTLCIACGLDLPYIQYCTVLEQNKLLPAHITPRYGIHWVRLITDLPAGLQEIRAGITTPGAYLRSLMGKATYSVFDWRDPLPAIGDMAIVLQRILKSLYKKVGSHE